MKKLSLSEKVFLVFMVVWALFWPILLLPIMGWNTQWVIIAQLIWLTVVVVFALIMRWKFDRKDIQMQEGVDQ